AVSGDDVRPEHADVIEIADRSASIFFAAVVKFFFHFGNMDQDRSFVFAGESGGILERFFGAGVDGVRRDGGMNQRVGLPALEEFFTVGGHLLFVFVVGDRKIDPGFAENGAHASGFGFFGDGVFEVIHVHVRGGAAVQHFRNAQASAPANEVFGDVFGFG